MYCTLAVSLNIYCISASYLGDAARTGSVRLHNLCNVHGELSCNYDTLLFLLHFYYALFDSDIREQLNSLSLLYYCNIILFSLSTADVIYQFAKRSIWCCSACPHLRFNDFISVGKDWLVWIQSHFVIKLA